jgi:hypothetical protein
MTASRSLVRLPSTATLLPEEAGRWDADCQTATTYIGGSGSGSHPGRLPFDPSTMVRCQDYHAHQTSHHRDGNGWTCDLCQVPA